MIQPTQTLLRWKTAEEQNVAYFEVQQSCSGDGFQVLAQLPASGVYQGASYSYSLESRQASCYYRVVAVDWDGFRSPSSVIRASGSAVPALSLQASEGALRLINPSSFDVSLRVSTLQGQTAIGPIRLAPGAHSTWSCPPGVYLIQVEEPEPRVYKVVVP
ncbi:MAG: hypothetical protein HC842_04655 [Cytophagales bacterium]|nr:hypothetical protein [Cytophagales bacterium]